MTAHENSRLLPWHRGVFGVNVESVEVCFCGLGLPDCVPPIFFNIGGQARSGRAIFEHQMVFAVRKHMAKGLCRATAHGKDFSAWQSLCAVL
jgi:hypothetical protein